MNRLIAGLCAGFLALIAVNVIRPAAVPVKADAAEITIPVDLPILDIENPVITQSCRLPDGDIFLKKPISATNLEKINLVGGNRSRIRWQGEVPVDGIIRFVGVRKGSIGGDGTLGFEVIVEKSGVNAVVLIANSPIKGGFISSGIQLRNVHVRHGGSQIAADKGFSIDSHICDPTGSGHGHANNENHRFFNCSVESCLKAAFHVRGYQAYDISFRDCDGYDAGRVVKQGFATKEAAIFWAEMSEYKGNYTIGGGGASWHVYSRNWIYGVHIESGASVILKNCNFNRTRCDVFMGWPCARATFEGHNSEHSRQFVANVAYAYDPVTGQYTRTAATSSDYYVHARDVRFDCEPLAGMPNVVDMWGRGPTTITNSFFNGINGVCPQISVANYADKINGVWVPFRSVLDLGGVVIGQHGGRLPKGPIVSVPTTGISRLFGVQHKHIDAAGKPSWRPVAANQPLQSALEN